MTRLGRMPWRVNSRQCDDLNVVEHVQDQEEISEPAAVQYSSESRAVAPEKNNSSGHVAEPRDENQNDLSSDDDGPDVEVADAARERVEQQVASEHAAKQSRLAERRARAKAKESAIAAQKKMRNAPRSVENVPELSDDVFERAAEAADIAAALDVSRAKAIGLRTQRGTLRIPQKRIVVDGKEVVDLSSQRKSCVQADSGRDALKFLRKSMYGPDVKRVKAVHAIRKDKAARNLRGRSRVGRRSKSINRE
jgi:hypothetical protein